MQSNSKRTGGFVPKDILSEHRLSLSFVLLCCVFNRNRIFKRFSYAIKSSGDLTTFLSFPYFCHFSYCKDQRLVCYHNLLRCQMGSCYNALTLWTGVPLCHRSLAAPYVTPVSGRTSLRRWQQDECKWQGGGWLRSHWAHPLSAEDVCQLTLAMTAAHFKPHWT